MFCALLVGWPFWHRPPNAASCQTRRGGYRFAEVRAAVTQAGRTVAEIPRLSFGAVPDCASGPVCIVEKYIRQPV